jgi:hypothetical protein
MERCVDFSLLKNSWAGYRGYVLTSQLMFGVYPKPSVSVVVPYAPIFRALVCSTAVCRPTLSSLRRLALGWLSSSSSLADRRRFAER